ncbi:glycosyltransferase family 4 protein, partial [Enterococcus sp. 6D12_DIV0197]|uniref:glycosyltransferase family 4 protein n=1 Tax=Enterococcus sp. 6D12_DIV0197 TaxID=1834184 RepID=UPI00148367A4
FFIGKYADDVVVVSKAVKNHLISSKLIKESKVSVVYNGVDNTIYNSNHDINYLYDEFGLSKNNIVIGMVGRVNSWKGQEHFLQAISSILKKNSDVYGILVGGVFDNESYRMENLKNQIADLNISQQVIVEDFRNDIPAIYDLFDIFVLPSTNPDPLPTVVLEAMASGKPVIGYSHGGVTEMVENGYNGFLCEVNNVKDLEQKIDFLISNEKVRKEMANNSSTRQKKYFSLESYINNFEKLYSSR